MDRQQREALDRHITGNYGEDQFRGQADDDDDHTLHVSVDLPPDVLAATGLTLLQLQQRAAQAVLDTLEGAVKPRPAWVVPDGYQPDGVGACSTCHQHILWVHTKLQRRMPLDPDGTSHFATCPQADMHRRRPPSPLATLMPTDHTVEDHS